MSSPTDSDDPFPRDQAVDLVRRLPAYARLALAVGRDDALPARQRAALIAAGTYVVSPIGLVPGFIPLLGQLDDLYVLLRAIRFALDGVSPQSRAEHLAVAEVTEDDLEADFVSVSDLVSWSARRGRATAVRAAAAGRRLGKGLSERAGRLREDIARRLEENWADSEQPQ